MTDDERVEEIVRYVAGDFSELESYTKGSHCGVENYVHHWPGSTCRKHRPDDYESWCWPCKAADALGRPVPELAEVHRGPWPGVSKEWERSHQERIRADRVRLFGEEVARRMEVAG